MEKSGLIWEELGKFIIAIVVLIILILIIYLFRGKLNEVIEIFKNILRFGA